MSGSNHWKVQFASSNILFNYIEKGNRCTHVDSLSLLFYIIMHIGELHAIRCGVEVVQCGLVRMHDEYNTHFLSL